VAGIEHGAREDHVAQRPQAFIGEAIVIAVLLILGKPDAAQCVTRILGRHAQVVVGVDHPSVGIAAGVSHPDAAAGAQDRFQRGDHAAGRRHALDAPADVAVLIRFAVGEQHQLPVAQALLNEIVQRVFSPHRGYLLVLVA
jgi:hypothetical protein